MTKFDPLDPIVHSRIRLSIFSVLTVAQQADFAYLKDATDGNLSTHLTKLESVGYIIVAKSFIGKIPKTTITMTNAGKDAFNNYVKALNNYLNPKTE